MKNFSQFLTEMNLDQSMETLGLSGTYDEKDLKTAYRRASAKAHPDKGGSTEAQQKVNAAYEFLKKNVAATKIQDDREAIWKQYREMSVLIRDDLRKNFNVEMYSKFFTEVFGEEFNGLVTSNKPQEEDMPRRGSPYMSSISLEWSNDERTKVFQLQVSVTLSEVFNSGGLASPGTTYPMNVSTFAYLDNRKVKITSRDYTNSSKKAVFTKPDSVFPKSKIVRKKQTKFKKSDMISALKAEIRAINANEFWFIPLKGDKFLAVTRGTMRRQAYWSIQGIWYQKSKYSWKRDESYDRPFMSFGENENTLNMFKQSKGSDPNKVLKMFKTEYQRLIN